MKTQAETTTVTVATKTPKAAPTKKEAPKKATKAAPKKEAAKKPAATKKAATKAPVSKAERARQIHAKHPELTTQAIVRKMEAEGIKVYFSQVQSAIAVKEKEEATA